MFPEYSIGVCVQLFESDAIDYKIYLKEIILITEKVENSIRGKTYEDFVSDFNLFDATLMRIHFIGETIKSIPYSLKKNYKKIRWKKFAKEYNVDLKIIRNVISNSRKEYDYFFEYADLRKLKKLKVELLKKIDI